MTDGVRSLINRLDVAVALHSRDAIAEQIKSDLSGLVRDRSLVLPEEFRKTKSDCYARRLLHRDPGLRYTVVVMTWGPGQGTPLHDHAGTWCVEAVVEGQMEVTQYDLVDDQGDRCRFREASRVHAEVGSSGCLIPPFEYHVLKNAFSDRSSITVHVYGGEMDRCCAFEPCDDGWFTRHDKILQYHD